MSISKYAKKKAFDYAQRVFKIANPKADVNSGSAIRSLFLLPFSLIYASLFQDQDIIREMHIGNYNTIGQGEMDTIAGNLLQRRPQGSRSATTLRVYVSDIQAFSLDPFPYFQSVVGSKFMPIRPMTFGTSDFLEDNGELYVNVPVVSTIYGPASAAREGEIQLFSNMPDVVTRVNNPSATIGGDSVFTNEEFYTYIRNSFNDGTLAQSNGVRKYITDNFPDVGDVNIIHAGNPLMIRDEVWTEDGINPNLDRLGEPFASHTPIGEVDFDYEFGRVKGSFSSDMKGKRISVDGDPEKFRTIIDITDNGTAIVSGYPLEGKSDAKIYGKGPSIFTMSDIYMYFPALEIKSKVVDNRQNSELSGFSHSTRFYYTDVITYDSGIVVYGEGLGSEERFRFISRGSDANGTYLQLDVSHGISISSGDPITAYSMEEISISEDGDISNLPVLYVLQVEQIDPLTFDTVGIIPQSSPGEYSQPGWYMRNADPANVFSAKENKTLVLDEKVEKNAFKPLSVNASVRSADTLVNPSFNFENMEGRSINVDIAQLALTPHLDIDTVAVTIEDGNLVVPGMDVEYMSGTHGRNDISVITYRDSDLMTPFYQEIGTVFARDNLLVRDLPFHPDTSHAKVFFGRIGDMPALPEDGEIIWSGQTLHIAAGGSFYPASTNGEVVYPVIPARDFESVIMSVPDENSIEITIDEDMVYPVNNDNYVDKYNATISAESLGGTFSSGPIRVTYATNSSIEEIQNALDDGQDRLLCDHTLARSMMPTVIDAEIKFSGESSSEVLYNAFIDLMQEALREVDRGERIRLDISNIVAAFNEDGLADSMDVNFEIRVTNFLPDGEYQVRYINPSDKTRQSMAVSSAISIGQDRITLRRTRSREAIPGRGKVFLGGNNPDTQEIIPYEAVIDNGDGTFEIVLRGGWPTKFEHPAWETAYVSVRDYDPDLEFKEGAVFIPSNNRPYVRKLVVIKK